MSWAIAKQLGFRCSFCGKGSGSVQALVMGPTVAICDDCTLVVIYGCAKQGVDIVDILAQERIDALERERDTQKNRANMYDRCLDEIHRAAGINRNGIALMLGWIEDAKATAERASALERERDEARFHIEAAGDGLNLLAVLDLYRDRAEKAERERDEARADYVRLHDECDRHNPMAIERTGIAEWKDRAEKAEAETERLRRAIREYLEATKIDLEFLRHPYKTTFKQWQKTFTQWLVDKRPAEKEVDNGD